MKRKSSFAILRAPLAGAFTLTELLVVVVIIAVLASIVAPLAMKSTSAVVAKSRAMERLSRERQAAMEAGFDPGAADAAILPVIQSFDLDLVLSNEPERLGLEVYNRFLLRGEGTLTIEAPKGAEDSSGDRLVQVTIPFPEDTIEAADVYFRVITGKGVDSAPAREPDGVEYRQSGIHWLTRLSPGELVEAEIGFTTLGTERMEWPLPQCRRLENIRLSLDLADTSARGVTSYSLSPTAVEGAVSRWEYANLVSDRQLVVEVPGAESPSGRLIQLLRFMAVAVLMFGGGFLYMNERDCPGRLDEFRLGHFSLLALNYSLFFIVFAVIIYHEQLTVLPALVVASLSSLPLLVVHVARLANWRFAAGRILPLAILTLAVVVNGVYGGAARDYIFLGVVVASLGYVTATYGNPGERRPVAHVLA